MIPQIAPVGAGGSGLQVNTSITPERADTTGRGERAEPLTSGRTETARPTLPPEASDRAAQVTSDPRPSFIAPDPNAPAGPPPSFEASILDRAREAAIGAAPLSAPFQVKTAEPGELVASLATPAVAAPPQPAEAQDKAAPATRDPYAVPPTASERAEGNVATLRRLEMPYDTATVDVAR